MPCYVYICSDCGAEFEEFRSVGDHNVQCPECSSKKIDRDYQTEFSGVGVIGDWPPGYNVGIDYHYKSKSDLMNEIRRRGWEPSRYSGGLTPANRPLYEHEKDKESSVKQSDDVVVED